MHKIDTVRRKYPFAVIHGIDYSGKTTILDMLTQPENAERIDGVPPELGDLQGLNADCTTEQRFYGFMELNRRQSELIKRKLEYRPVIQIRYVATTLAFHNIALSQERGEEVHLEEGEDFGGFITPDISFLVTVNRADIGQRMEERPPKHRYETDVDLLLAVQEEKTRLLGRPELQQVYGKTVVVPNPNGRLREAAMTIDRYLSEL